MQIQTHLMQKNGLVAMKLAREMITAQVGDRINTIQEYSAKYDTGRGTVQSAIKLLTEYNAVQLEPRGHLGTYITFMDYKILWEFTGLGTIMGVMPLPYSKLYEGLATGLYKVLNLKQIPFSLAYMRGAEPRISALLKGRYDFVVVSRLAASSAIMNGQEIEIAVEFGKYSYVSEHAVFFADDNNKEIEDGMKIGVDRSSIDHYVLTINQCADKKVEIIDMAYNQVMSKLQKHEIDAAIWNVDEILERKLAIKYYPIRSNKFKDSDTEAVIVVCRKNYGIKNLLSSFINSQDVRGYQEQVINGELIPRY